MADKIILLIEDNPDDVELTLRALKVSNILNEVVVVRDGEEALDYLFGTGTYEGRDTSFMPAVIILDLKLPKVDGMEVLRRIRADERTKDIRVAVLTASKREIDKIEGYGLGANSYINKPSDFARFAEAVRLGVYWLLPKEPPPKYYERERVRPPEHRRDRHRHRERRKTNPTGGDEDAEA